MAGVEAAGEHSESVGRSTGWALAGCNAAWLAEHLARHFAGVAEGRRDAAQAAAVEAGTAAETEPELESETAVAEPATAEGLQPESETGAEPELEAGVKLEPAAGAELGDDEPEPEAETMEAVGEPVPAETAQEPEPEPERELELEMEMEPKLEKEVLLEPEAEAEAEAELEPEPAPEAEPPSFEFKDTAGDAITITGRPPSTHRIAGPVQCAILAAAPNRFAGAASGRLAAAGGPSYSCNPTVRRSQLLTPILCAAGLAGGHGGDVAVVRPSERLLRPAAREHGRRGEGLQQPASRLRH